MERRRSNHGRRASRSFRVFPCRTPMCGGVRLPSAIRGRVAGYLVQVRVVLFAAGIESSERARSRSGRLTGPCSASRMTASSHPPCMWHNYNRRLGTITSSGLLVAQPCCYALWMPSTVRMTLCDKRTPRGTISRGFSGIQQPIGGTLGQRWTTRVRWLH